MRVVIGEDSVLFREGLAALLEASGHEVVGLAWTGQGTICAVTEAGPDLAIVDVRMDEADSGIQVARQLRSRRPPVPVLLLSQDVEVRGAFELVTQGAIGYLLKDRVLDVADFLSAMERVAGGGSALEPEVVSRLLTAASAQRGLAALTARESDVLRLMAEGWSNQAVAARLFISERTVESHISNLLLRLGIDEMPEGNRRVKAILTYLNAR